MKKLILLLLFIPFVSFGQDFSAEEFFYKAQYKAQMGYYSEAIKDLNESIKLDNKNAQAYGDRGLNYYKLKKYYLAERDYDQAIRIDPKNGNAYLNRGILNYALGKKYQSCNDVRKARSLGVDVQLKVINIVCNQ